MHTSRDQSPETEPKSTDVIIGGETTPLPPLESDSKPPIPPDGGARAWFHVLLCHLLFFNTWGVTNSYGVFQQYYTGTLDREPSDIAWVGSLQMFLLFFVGVFSGRASDAGYFRLVFYSGVVLQVLGLCLTSLAKTYWQILLSQGICMGLGNGLAFTPGLSVTSSYFKKRKFMAIGLSAAGAATGGMVYPATLNALLYHSDIGYPWAMRVLGLIMLVAYIPGIVGYRPLIPRRSSGPIVDWVAFRDKSFVFFTIGMFLHFWGLYMAFFYLGISARQTIHLDDSLNLLIVLNAVGIIGRSVPNFIGERYTGVVNTTLFCSFVGALCMYCWPAVHNAAGLYAWAVVYGLSAGGLQALFPALATQQAPQPDRVGTWTGMVLSIVSFASLTAAPIQGALIQQDGGRYLGAQMFSGSSIVAGAIFLALGKWTISGKLRKPHMKY